MPRFARKSVRRYSRRRGTLSTRRIFSNKSARSQASQIHALKRKITYIAKRNRPEYKVYTGTPSTFDMTNSAFNQSYLIATMPVPSPGTGDNQRIGNVIKPINLQFRVYLEYANNKAAYPNVIESDGGCVRITLLQYKAAVPTNQIPASPTAIYENASGTGAGYTLQSLLPFVRGITQTFNILYDRTFTVSADNNQRTIKIKIPTYKLRSIQFDNEGHANICVWMITTSGLHWTSGGFEEHIQGALYGKMVYTDA